MLLNYILLIVMALFTTCSFKGQAPPDEIKLTIYNRSTKPIDSIYIDLAGRRKFFNPVEVNRDTTFGFNLRNYMVNERETTFMAIVFQDNYHYPLGFGFQWMGKMDTTTHYHYYVFDNGINTKDVAPLHTTEKTYSSK